MNKCPLCENSDIQIIHAKFRNNEDMNAYRCSKCTIVFSEEVFSLGQKQVDDFYKEEYLEKYFADGKEKIDQNFTDKTPYQFERIERMKAYLSAETSVLEVGCGPGYFLKVLREKGIHADGLELNKIERKYANEIVGINVVEKPTQLKQKYDVICALQVLEHTSDPVDFLRTYAEWLNEGGHFIIEVPTIHNPIVSLYNSTEFKNFWYQRPHLFYFSKETLSLVLEKAFNRKPLELNLYQETGFINHYNWARFGQKSKSRAEALLDNFPLAIENKELKSQLDDCFSKFNIEYKRLLESAQYGDTLLAVVKI